MQGEFKPRSSLFYVPFDENDRTIAGIEEMRLEKRFVREHHFGYVWNCIECMPDLLALGALWET